ncbi:hypothetical protein ZWY2020_054920 [Hordeum vulgare]|nr:hypothetical protein ZWY2020_054920 [Hordeum vulgare]
MRRIAVKIPLVMGGFRRAGCAYTITSGGRFLSRHSPTDRLHRFGSINLHQVSHWITIRDEENDILAGRYLQDNETPKIGQSMDIDGFHLIVGNLCEAQRDEQVKAKEEQEEGKDGRMMDAASIAWLVQTILSTLLIDKLDEWIRQVGLADDVEKLKLEIRTVKVVVSAVKGGAIGNEPLAKSLAILKELLYDGDDLVDELDYYRLQQQVQADPGVLVPSNFAVQGG